MKRSTNVTILVLSLFLSGFFMTAQGNHKRPVDTTQIYQQQSPLVRRTDKRGSVKPQSDPTVIRSQNVIVDIQRLRSRENASFTLPLFDGRSLTLIRDRQEQAGKKGFVWYGKVANEPGSTVILSVIGEVLAGNVTTQKAEIYQIRYIGNGVHSLRQIDQSKFPQEADPEVPKLKPVDEGADTCSTDPPTDIDVMVVYTATTRAAAGGTDAMEATIYLAVSETNQSYLNSNITQRLRLAHMEEIVYAESGNITTDRNNLQAGSTAPFINVHTLRNTFAADVVVLIQENGGGFCGISYIMDPVSNAFESFGYAVVARNCATGYYSFGHELGHIMSARHDWFVDPTNNSPYVFNHGFTKPAPSSPATPWRTVMAYNNACTSVSVNCTRIPYWSDPFINYPPGDAMGVSAGPQQSDNHQTLNNTALTVANFRCSSPGAGNVWMKDTWNDTGAEPDPLTAAQDMWQSPYIWVRNTQDTTLVHQHQHENPEFGSTNWVYVKLHNGFNTTTSGNLELYWANASTGLSWPSDWNLLTSIPVTAFAAHGTRVVEAQWNNLPGTGHFCMVARWVSSFDPMATTETTDINANVRANNNIVWRNLNIVDLVHDSSGDASFIVRNPRKERMVTSLIIRSPKNELESSFIRNGQVTVRFDDVLMKAWRQGGGKGRGFKTDGRTFVVTDPTGAVFENLVLDRDVGHVNLTFKRLPNTPRRTFIIDVVQLTPTGGAGRYGPTGGVSYEIHTDSVERSRKVPYQK
jgi:hypothetical protein